MGSRVAVKAVGNGIALSIDARRFQDASALEPTMLLCRVST